MTGQAFRGFFGFSQIQNFRHTLADVAGQRLIGATVLVLNDPGGIFILQNAAAGHRFYTAMATGGGAGAGADIFVVRFVLRQCAARGARSKKRESGERANVERDSAKPSAGMIGASHARCAVAC